MGSGGRTERDPVEPREKGENRLILVFLRCDLVGGAAGPCPCPRHGRLPLRPPAAQQPGTHVASRPPQPGPRSKRWEPSAWQGSPRSCGLASTRGTDRPGKAPGPTDSPTSPTAAPSPSGESARSLLPGEELSSWPVIGGGREVRSGGVETLRARRPGRVTPPC